MITLTESFSLTVKICQVRLQGNYSEKKELVEICEHFLAFWCIYLALTGARG